MDISNVCNLVNITQLSFDIDYLAKSRTLLQQMKYSS